MDLSHIVIILCKPNDSKNIGSVCRAMLTMGLRRLRIIGNKADYKAEEIKTLAVHAFDIWNKAEFYDELTQAVDDCVFSAGTTRRRGQKRKKNLLLPEELAAKIFSLSAFSPPTAIVFGNERTGLTDDELNVCNAAVTIPSDSESESGSLNLSHAVQIIGYELYRKAQPLKPSYIPVTQSRLKKTTASITENLGRIGFFSVTGKTEMKRFWLSVLARAALSEEEALYMEKIFTKAAALSLKHKSNIID